VRIPEPRERRHTNSDAPRCMLTTMETEPYFWKPMFLDLVWGLGSFLFLALAAKFVGIHFPSAWVLLVSPLLTFATGLVRAAALGSLWTKTMVVSAPWLIFGAFLFIGAEHIPWTVPLLLAALVVLPAAGGIWVRRRPLRRAANTTAVDE